MNDSADIKRPTLKEAAHALQSAVASLETALDPLVSRFAQLETKAREADAFSEDRVRLAGQLDEALEARRRREAEFETLSKQTREELDMTIAALQQALGDTTNG